MMTPTVNGKEVTVGPPLWLLAEVTYACPLHCVFCYNPVDYTKHGPELTTQEWINALARSGVKPMPEVSKLV